MCGLILQLNRGCLCVFLDANWCSLFFLFFFLRIHRQSCVVLVCGPILQLNRGCCLCVFLDANWCFFFFYVSTTRPGLFLFPTANQRLSLCVSYGQVNGDSVLRLIRVCLYVFLTASHERMLQQNRGCLYVFVCFLLAAIIRGCFCVSYCQS